MSRPFPCGTPSTTSTRTTSASSLSAMRTAQLAPTFPAPTTVTLFRKTGSLISGDVTILARFDSEKWCSVEQVGSEIRFTAAADHSGPVVQLLGAHFPEGAAFV